MLNLALLLLALLQMSDCEWCGADEAPARRTETVKAAPANERPGADGRQRHDLSPRQPRVCIGDRAVRLPDERDRHLSEARG